MLPPRTCSVEPLTRADGSLRGRIHLTKMGAE
jgi:hypothetical protein